MGEAQRDHLSPAGQLVAGHGVGLRHLISHIACPFMANSAHTYARAHALHPRTFLLIFQHSVSSRRARFVDGLFSRDASRTAAKRTSATEEYVRLRDVSHRRPHILTWARHAKTFYRRIIIFRMRSVTVVDSFAALTARIHDCLSRTHFADLTTLDSSIGHSTLNNIEQNRIGTKRAYRT